MSSGGRNKLHTSKGPLALTLICVTRYRFVKHTTLYMSVIQFCYNSILFWSLNHIMWKRGLLTVNSLPTGTKVAPVIKPLGIREFSSQWEHWYTQGIGSRKHWIRKLMYECSSELWRCPQTTNKD